MKKQWRALVSLLERWVRTSVASLKKLFDPAIFVGDRDRVRKPDESDEDDKKLGELNRTWRQMLKEDPWMQKLMTHVRLLLWVVGIFWLSFVVAGQLLPARHPLLVWFIAGSAATIPYWLWIGGWHKKIEVKVFEAFQKKFGKHFHRR